MNPMSSLAGKTSRGSRASVVSMSSGDSRTSMVSMTSRGNMTSGDSRAGPKQRRGPASKSPALPWQPRSRLPVLLGLLLLPYRLGWWFSRARHGDRNRRLRLALTELGPIYIKFGQLLSTRHDFIDPALATELQVLQDQVPPFLTPPITELVAHTLGAPAETLFASLQAQPLAAASVAQVHAARLPDGTEVVVKVLRPGVEQLVAEDLALLKWLARLLQRHSALGRRL